MNFGFEVTGLVGLLGLILMIWAILNVAQARMGALGKALWIVVLLLVPFIGWILWFFFGPRSAEDRHSRWRRHGY